jgi:hypothetical protein
MNVKQYTRLYFFTIAVFVAIAFWQQFKMASIQGMHLKASELSSALQDKMSHHPKQDSLHVKIQHTSTVLERYQHALHRLKTTHPEAAKQFEADLNTESHK